MKIPIVAALFSLTVTLALAVQPNILFILADDLGYGEVGKFPCTSTHGRIATPNLDSFADEGMRFTDAYAGEAVCAPSRCTLMTGKHTGHARVRGNRGYEGHDFPLLSNDTTVAKVLKNAGYNTALIGKWGLGYNGTSGAPLNQGFDYYYGQLDQNACHNYYPLSIWENTNILNLPENKNASRERCMSEPASCRYTQDLFTSAATKWLKSQTKEKPWYLFLTYTNPHAGGWEGTLESGAPVPTDGAYVDKPWPVVERDHASAVTLEDRDIGSILNTLKVLGFENDTIVFFASDNGAHNEGGHSHLFFNSSGPLRGFKRSLYEGGIRSPSMVRWPGKVKPGSVSHYSWAFWDFLPTAAELAGVPKSNLPLNLDGISIVPTLLGQEQSPKDYLYWEFCTNNKWGHAVRVQNWKAVSFAVDEPFELYDLSTDIHENVNLAEKYPDIVKRLETIAKSAHSDDPYFPIINCVSS
eukprot:TRINITY_DN1921_c0_g1_i1.p1 TRINITY_DN1921_c0_g1~~TRINITY_DN1921_c0_g1_i1.p1  ORF type:complete len:469 (-),score=55.74 TRINITY_DN1921_c0_g1_i1:57-1463(-)